MTIDSAALERLEAKIDRLVDSVNALDTKWTERIVPIEAALGSQAESRQQLMNTLVDAQKHIGELQGRATIAEERHKVSVDNAGKLSNEVVVLREKVSDLEKSKWQIIGAAGGVSALIGLVIQFLSLAKHVVP